MVSRFSLTREPVRHLIIRPPESETVGWSQVICVLTSRSGNADACWERLLWKEYRKLVIWEIFPSHWIIRLVFCLFCCILMKDLKRWDNRSAWEKNCFEGKKTRGKVTQPEVLCLFLRLGKGQCFENLWWWRPAAPDGGQLSGVPREDMMLSRDVCLKSVCQIPWQEEGWGKMRGFLQNGICSPWTRISL